MPYIYNLACRYIQNGKRVVKGALFNEAALLAPVIAEKYGLEGVQMFPMTETQSGTAPDGDGYGKRRDGRISPTRFATTDAEVLRGIACCHACGLIVGSDEVTHQYDGSQTLKGTDILYPEYGEGMVPGAGDFSKPEWGFVGAPPRSPVDNVFSSEGNFGFGDMTSLINSGHDGFMLAGMIRTMVRRAKYADFDFWRHDDAKGTAVAASKAFAQAMNMLSYAEVFSGNLSVLQDWWYQNGYRMGLLDFPLHWMLADACNGYNANALSGQALCHINPGLAWKNRDTGDTDQNDGQSVAANGLIANMRVLTAPGDNALMYAKDYESYAEGGYNLSEKIVNYTWIAKNLRFGAEEQRWRDNSAAAFESLGYPGLLTIFNFDTYNNRDITVQSNFGPNTEVWEYTGTLHARCGYSSLWTDGQGRLRIPTVPCNAFSRGSNSLAFSRTGYRAPFKKLSPRNSTNVFEGAQNLIIPRATAAGSLAGKIWCEASTAVDLNKTAGDGVRFTVTGPSGEVIIDRGKWAGKTSERGYHTIAAFSPSSAPEAYTLEATYMATKGLMEADVQAEIAPNYEEVSERGQELIEKRLARRRRFVPGIEATPTESAIVAKEVIHSFTGVADPTKKAICIFDFSPVAGELIIVDRSLTDSNVKVSVQGPFGDGSTELRPKETGRCGLLIHNVGAAVLPFEIKVTYKER